MFDKKEYCKKYYLEHKEKFIISPEKARLKYLKGREKILLRQKSFYILKKKNPEFVFNHYKTNAKGRNVEFCLTLEQFKSFWNKNCYYCNDKIETIGLDRINSKKGYIFDNIVSCCANCNFGKRTLSKNEFIGLCKKVAKNHL